jgi:hypothetical protein
MVKKSIAFVLLPLILLAFQVAGTPGQQAMAEQWGIRLRQITSLSLLVKFIFR